MKLLFTPETFEENFKTILGFVDSDISFISVASDLITATRQLISIIGNSTYDRFIEILAKEEERNEDEDEYLQMARFAVAINTYRIAAPSKDVQHTNQGRLMRTDEHQARPFPWMIDRNDKINEKKYYRAIDDLLEKLFKDSLFKETDEYKKIKSLFVSTTSDFEEYFPIESGLLLIKLQPGIRKAQNTKIKAILGIDRYNTLLTKHKDATQMDSEELELYELIKEACIYYSLHWAMTRLTVNLLPEGLLQQYTSDRQSTRASKTPEGLQTQLASQEFKNDAELVFKSIQNKITKLTTTSSTADQDDSLLDFNEDDKFATT